MPLRDRLQAALVEAMKARQAARLSTLRLINAAVKDRDILSRGEGGEAQVPDSEITTILGKLIRQRQESAHAYDEAGRLDLAERERAEIEVIREFLPRQLTEAEAEAAIQAAIVETAAVSIRDVGKVMAALKAHHAGQMDFAAVGARVKARFG